MAKSAGISVPISADRVDLLLDHAREYGQIPEAVFEFSHSRNVPLVCFLSMGKRSITHIALGKRGMRASVDQRRLNMRDLTELAIPIRHRDILAVAANRSKSIIADRLRNGGLFPPGAFAALVEAIRELSPSSRPLLDRFSKDRQRRIDRMSSESRLALAYQKETVATALALADIDRLELQNWQPPEEGESASSFLDGLPQIREHEDMMVITDLTRVPGYEFIAGAPHGAAIFENETTRLTIVIANHLALEQQLGADLIYFNETYKAFTIVQYKAMEGDSDDKAIYRFPNAQLTEELDRMSSHLELLEQCTKNNHIDGYRLLENPFFLKLCPRIQFNPDDIGLVNGMYIPLGYWRLIENDRSFVGPRGGRFVTYGNVGRYLNNSGFIQLVGDAWIGTNANQSETLREIVRAVMATNRTITLAFKTDKKPDPPGKTTVAQMQTTSANNDDGVVQVFVTE